MRTCRQCGQDKPLTAFSPRARSEGPRRHCDTCRASAEAARRAARTPEQVDAERAKRRARIERHRQEAAQWAARTPTRRTA